MGKLCVRIITTNKITKKYNCHESDIESAVEHEYNGSTNIDQNIPVAEACIVCNNTNVEYIETKKGKFVGNIMCNTV
jgi:hypothetical protein